MHFLQTESTNSLRIGGKTRYFLKKKEIICAGLNAYKNGGIDNIINCIKNLISEIEGIVQLHYHRDLGKKPTTRELKDYMIDQGKERFPYSGTLAFPELFYEYLEGFSI